MIKMVKYILYKDYGSGREIAYTTYDEEEAKLLSKKEGLKIQVIKDDMNG